MFNPGQKVRLKTLVSNNRFYEYAKSILNDSEVYEVLTSYGMQNVLYVKLKGVKNKMFNSDVLTVVQERDRTEIVNNVYNLRTQEDYDTFMTAVKNRFLFAEMSINLNKNLWEKHKRNTCIRIEDDCIWYDHLIYYIGEGYKPVIYENGVW